MWKTDISTSSAGAFPHRLIPLFSISAQSDKKTKLSINYKGTYGSLSVNVNRVPGEKLSAEVDFNGKKFTVDISVNKAAMSADININAAGKQYKLTGKVSNADSWKISVVGNVGGPIDATILIKKDYKEAKIEVSHKNAKLVQMKLKGNRKPDGSFKVKSKFSLLGGKVATGEFDASYADGKLNVVIKPNNHPEFDFTFYMQPKYAGSNLNGASFGYETKKAG